MIPLPKPSLHKLRLGCLLRRAQLLPAHINIWWPRPPPLAPPTTKSLLNLPPKTSCSCWTRTKTSSSIWTSIPVLTLTHPVTAVSDYPSPAYTIYLYPLRCVCMISWYVLWMSYVNELTLSKLNRSLSFPFLYFTTYTLHQKQNAANCSLDLPTRKIPRPVYQYK